MEGRAYGRIDLGGETLRGETKPLTTTATKLTKIAKLSSESVTMEFGCLMPHFNKGSLTSCFHELNGKKAIGIDGVTKEGYGKNLEGNISKLIERMKALSYRPQAVREVLIPKAGSEGETRPLGISSFEDKIVQLQMAKILEAIYEPIFRESSYGFRPGKSCHSAVKGLHEHLSAERNETIIDVDLKNFFGKIRHEDLLNFLRIKIKDDRFIRYVARMLKAGIFKEGRFEVSDEGSPQGNIVSPILSNIYAHHVIDTWMEDVVPNHINGHIKLYRYADDSVICCQYAGDALRVERALRKRLNKYGLELNIKKTKIVNFNKRQFSKTKQDTFDYLGFTFYISLSRKGRVHVAVKTAKSRFNTKLRIVKAWCKRNVCKYKLHKLWEIFGSKLRGHIQYYGVSLNSRSVSSFIYQATGIFFKWINRRSQRRSITWKKFCQFRNAFPLPKGKICYKLF